MVQRVVDGLIYDTDTATEVAAITYSPPSLNRGYYSRTEEKKIFLTSRGAWFILDTLGNKIAPIAPDVAFNWLCEHDKASALKEHFPDRVEEA